MNCKFLIPALFLFFTSCKKNELHMPPAPKSCAEGRPGVNAQLNTLTTIPDPTKISGSVALGNKIYFLVHEYFLPAKANIYFNIFDVVTKTWTVSQWKLVNSRWAGELVVAEGKIFYAGGHYTDSLGNSTFLKDVEIYDVNTNTWTSTALSAPRYSLKAGVLQNKIFFAGGYILSGSVQAQTSLVEMYDLNTGSWTIMNLSEAKTVDNVITNQDKIYFIGGYIDNAPNSEKVEVFNSSTNSWTATTIPGLRIGMATIMADSKIIMAGGLKLNNGLNNKYEDVVDFWDVNTGAITKSCIFRESYGATAHSANNKIIFTNGQGSLAETNIFDIYDVPTQKWHVGKLPDGARLAFAVHVLQTGIYVLDMVAWDDPSNNIYQLLIP